MSRNSNPIRLTFSPAITRPIVLRHFSASMGLTMEHRERPTNSAGAKPSVDSTVRFAYSIRPSGETIRIRSTALSMKSRSRSSLARSAASVRSRSLTSSSSRSFVTFRLSITSEKETAIVPMGSWPISSMPPSWSAFLAGHFMRTRSSPTFARMYRMNAARSSASRRFSRRSRSVSSR